MGIDKTIAPKSDQSNADDFIAGPKTIKITAVKVSEGEQPVAISFEGDNGKPWKACKSMRRVLVNLWGSDEKRYIGRSLTLYRDDTVTWAGEAVGGIRISHMSHIDQDMSMPLSMSKKVRKSFTVKKLADSGAAIDPATIAEFDRLVKLVDAETAKKATDHIAKHGNQAGYEKIIGRLREVAPKGEPTAEEKKAIEEQIRRES